MTMRPCAISPSLPPPSCPRASASSRPRRRAAPSSTLRARPGPARGSTKSSRPAADTIVYPVAVGLVSAGAWHSARARAARLPACGGLELDFRRQPADPARPDRQPARAGAARAGCRRHRQTRDRQPRSTISAARRFAPISPRSVTRRSTRGCSGHDEIFSCVVPAKAGTHSHECFVVMRDWGPRPSQQFDSVVMGPGLRRDDGGDNMPAIPTARCGSASAVRSDRARPR